MEMRNKYKILVGKPEGKRLPEIFRRRWKDNIKMDIKETECGLDSGDSKYSPMAGSYEQGIEPQKTGNFLTS
jgi:hypothetical protein